MAKLALWMKRIIKGDGIAQQSERIALFPTPGSPVEEFHKPLPHSTVSRVIIRRLLTYLQLNARRQLTPGIAFCGYNIYKDTRPGYPRFRSLYALDYALKLKPISVLDVGSGGGYHALAFANAGGALEVEVQHLAEKMLHGKSVSTSECGRADRSTSTD